MHRRARAFQEQTFLAVIESTQTKIPRDADSHHFQYLPGRKHHHVTGAYQRVKVFPRYKMPVIKQLTESLFPVLPRHGIGNKTPVKRYAVLPEGVDICPVSKLSSLMIARSPEKRDPLCTVVENHMGNERLHSPIGVKTDVGMAGKFQGICNKWKVLKTIVEFLHFGDAHASPKRRPPTYQTVKVLGIGQHVDFIAEKLESVLTFQSSARKHEQCISVLFCQSRKIRPKLFRGTCMDGCKHQTDPLPQFSPAPLRMMSFPIISWEFPP